MILREFYLKKLRKLRDQNVIKVITGIRRCGKSTLFKQFQDELLASGVAKSNIIALNLEELENASLLEPHLLNDYIMRLINPQEQYYVFLDEIQNVPHFEKLVDSLFVKDNIDVYITGSNAYMLSGDLATVLSGRYIELSILPFSFAEFAASYSNTPSNEIFADYFEYGGFPEVTNFIHSGAKSEVSDYLDGIYKTVLEKDVKRRRSIRSDFDFTNVLKFTMDNIGSQLSPNNIANTLTSNGNSVNRLTVESYLSALTDSFVLYQAHRYDIKGKKLLQTLGKYYSVDIGLSRNILDKNLTADRGHLLENIVYLELLRRNKTVQIGKNNTKEVDFVATAHDGTIHYYQVAETMLGVETRERELSAFPTNHHQKIVLTLDAGQANYNGIEQLSLIDWLLDC
ncbi:MAG TPA: ATP-binding protein [Candidatus Saccharibacteria bacterium]|nr:ATP-binding protein [Candidatus Saccharibacteria bacterium]HMR38176.1 ATP-binding protein [Candidatus Saccharibacteria bacterium]